MAQPVRARAMGSGLWTTQVCLNQSALKGRGKGKGEELSLSLTAPQHEDLYGGV